MGLLNTAYEWMLKFVFYLTFATFLNLFLFLSYRNFKKTNGIVWATCSDIFSIWRPTYSINWTFMRIFYFTNFFVGWTNTLLICYAEKLNREVVTNCDYKMPAGVKIECPDCRFMLARNGIALKPIITSTIKCPNSYSVIITCAKKMLRRLRMPLYILDILGMTS